MVREDIFRYCRAGSLSSLLGWRPFEIYLHVSQRPTILGNLRFLWMCFSDPFSFFSSDFQLTSGDHTHLRDLSEIRFLVLDEADRMTQEHSFPQLIKILDAVHSANPRDSDDEENEDLEDDQSLDEGDGDRLLGLPGVRGEAQLTMLTDSILDNIEAQKGSDVPKRKEISDEEFPAENVSEEENDDFSVQSFGSVEKDKVHRQTFVYSATLTLPFTSTQAKGTTKGNKRNKKLGLEGGIAEILEKTRAMGETKVVDLSSTTPSRAFSIDGKTTGGVRLPPGLSLEQIKCTQRHKDSHLYAYLMTTSQGASGPCLVFCNSIAAVRRVGATLQMLGFSVRTLHAHMEQVRHDAYFDRVGLKAALTKST